MTKIEEWRREQYKRAERLREEHRHLETERNAGTLLANGKLEEAYNKIADLEKSNAEMLKDCQELRTVEGQIEDLCAEILPESKAETTHEWMKECFDRQREEIARLQKEMYSEKDRRVAAQDAITNKYEPEIERLTTLSESLKEQLGALDTEHERELAGERALRRELVAALKALADDSSCGDHCSNACRQCQAFAALAKARELDAKEPTK